jgi:hypothetical protein
MILGRRHQGFDGFLWRGESCSSAAGARNGSVSARSAKPGPDASDQIRRNHERRLGFISGNVLLAIIWLKELTPRLGI